MKEKVVMKVKTDTKKKKNEEELLQIRLNSFEFDRVSATARSVVGLSIRP